LGAQKIGFSGNTQNQPKNEFKSQVENKAFLHFFPIFFASNEEKSLVQFAF